MNLLADTNQVFMFYGAIMFFIGMVLMILSKLPGLDFIGHVPFFLISFSSLVFLNGLTMDAIMNNNISTSTIVLSLLQFPVLILSIFAFVKIVKHGQVPTRV